MLEHRILQSLVDQLDNFTGEIDLPGITSAERNSSTIGLARIPPLIKALNDDRVKTVAGSQFAEIRLRNQQSRRIPSFKRLLK